MKTNKELLAIAKKQINNTGGKYRKYVGEGGSWCNMFVYWLFNANGCGSLFPMKTKYQKTYCPSSIKWCKSNLAQIPPYLAMACDIIYFDWEPNGNPNHIGIVQEKVNTSTITTIEGNTNGGIVAKKNRSAKYVQAVFRPHFKPTVHLSVLAIDGSFGYKSIANLQRALGGIPVDGVLNKVTVKRLQHYLAIKEDGAWGAQTSRAVQKLVGVKQDGEFGPASVKALQKWINKKNSTPEPEPEPEPEPAPVPEPTPVPQTNADKIVAKAREFAYSYGTSSKKYKYKGGKPLSAYKSALKKHLGKTAKISQSDCGYFVTTCVRAAGVSRKFLALRGRKESFPSVPSTMKIVHKGKKIPVGLLKPGDIIRYKKSGGGQHTLMYYGNNKIAEAGRGHWFPAVKKDTKKYNKANVKKSSIQVIRAK